MVKFAVILHVFVSVTVRAYDPAGKPPNTPLFGWVGVHEYVYPGVPPFTVVEIDPLLPPKQDMFEKLDAVMTKAVGSVIVTACELVHPLASVTKQVYVFAPTLAIIEDVCPLGDHK